MERSEKIGPKNAPLYKIRKALNGNYTYHMTYPQDGLRLLHEALGWPLLLCLLLLGQEDPHLCPCLNLNFHQDVQFSSAAVKPVECTGVPRLLRTFFQATNMAVHVMFGVRNLFWGFLGIGYIWFS